MKTILVLEDETSVLGFIDAALSREGHSVLKASDTQAAIQLAEGSASRIDLLILDHSLNDEANGANVADIIRRFRPDVKLLRISGYTADKLRQDGCLHPTDQFLAKPFGLRDLREAVQSIFKD